MQLNHKINVIRRDPRLNQIDDLMYLTGDILMIPDLKYRTYPKFSKFLYALCFGAALPYLIKRFYLFLLFPYQNQVISVKKRDN